MTNTSTLAAEVVQRYKRLADIERGFRVLKSDIDIGQMYHRLPQRIGSHALVCFMALVLYRVTRMRLTAAKQSESPATLLEQLKPIHQQTVQTTNGKTLTCLTEMTPAQKSLFAALDLALLPQKTSPNPFFSLRIALVCNEINHLRAGSVKFKGPIRIDGVAGKKSQRRSSGRTKTPN